MELVTNALCHIKDIFIHSVWLKLVALASFLVVADNSPKALICFLILLAIDTIMGALRSIKMKRFSSKTFRKKIFNKLTAYLVVLIGANLLTYIDPLFIHFRRIVILFLSSSEMISILESLKTAVYDKLPTKSLVAKLLSVLKEKE